MHFGMKVIRTIINSPRINFAGKGELTNDMLARVASTGAVKVNLPPRRDRHLMAGTRRSTRQTATKAPTYAENSPSPSTGDEQPRANGKPSTRRKRARENVTSSPPRKVARPSHPKPSAAAAAASASATPASSEPIKRALPVASTSSDSNRDANGDQEVFWLLKAEPLPRIENGVNVAFSIDDLAACTVPEPWSGVRNSQARNNMQAMRVGDLGFFYHSNAKPSGVVGILRIAEEAKVDETAFDSKDPYYDAQSDVNKPKWFCTSVEFVSKFDKVVNLHTIKSYAGKGGELEGMQLVTNSRLSVSRVRREEWEFIMALAERKEDGENGG